MSFGAAIKSCFSQYATFSGRARRSEFWWFYLFAFLVQLPFSILFTVLYLATFLPVLEQVDADGSLPEGAWDDANWGLMVIGVALLVIVSLFLLLPSLAVTARRLHDMGQTAHWMWLYLVGLSIVTFVMAFFDSEPGTNRWGPDPKANERIPPQGYASQPPGQVPPPPGYGNPPPQP